MNSGLTSGSRSGRAFFRADLCRYGAFAILLVGFKLGLYWLAACAHGGLAQAMCQWDCHWYMTIVTDGYDPQPRGDLGRANWAFFPLYSFGVRAVRSFLPPLLPAAITVSVVAFSGFLLLSLVYLRETRPRCDLALWTAFMAVMPFSFYFFAPYTEALYLLLATASLLAMHRRQALSTGLLLGLFTATRPTAVLLIPPFLAERLRRTLGVFRPGLALRARIEILADAALPVALAPVGLFGFMALLYSRTGDPLAFSHVQIAWGRSLENPFLRVWNGLLASDWTLLIHRGGDQSQSYCACFAPFCCVLAGWLFWQRRFLEAWFSLASLLLCLSTGLDSLPRYVAGNPVNLFAMLDLLSKLRPGAPRWLVLAVMAVLQGALVLAWFNHALFLA